MAASGCGAAGVDVAVDLVTQVATLPAHPVMSIQTVASRCARRISWDFLRTDASRHRQGARDHRHRVIEA